MSVRAELLRFGLRHLFKGRDDERPQLAALRRSLERIKAIVPNPPTGTAARRVEVGGVPALRVTTPRSQDDRHVLYLHGGAYVYGSPSLYRDFIWRIVDATHSTAWCLEYRLAPEHPFPAALEDAAAAYRGLLARGADPGRITIMGDSAGGGLTFAALLRLRQSGTPMPAAVVTLSPWTDLTLSSASAERNAKVDPMISRGQARVFAALYLGGTDPRDPFASPVYGDPAGLPPSLIFVGSDEILHDDATQMASRLHRAGCHVELEVWPRMPHVWPLFARILPEGKRAIERIGGFVRANSAN